MQHADLFFYRCAAHIQEMQRDIFAFDGWGNCDFVRILHDPFSLRCAAHFADGFACGDGRPIIGAIVLSGNFFQTPRNIKVVEVHQPFHIPPGSFNISFLVNTVSVVTGYAEPLGATA